MSEMTFHRKHLAQAYCDSLEGKGIANATSGLFLAGPRRVGKSTFLQVDLVPEAEHRGYLPIYVDLWANKWQDPALLIIEVLKKHLLACTKKLNKLVKRVQKVSLLQTIVLDLSQPGLPEHITLVDVLKEIVEVAAKPILLIIDEAQHALTTVAGLNAMFAIKSARDQMNMRAGAPQLMLVLIGSQRDKLAQLVIRKDQPFFGSDVTSFPLLGKEYVDTFTNNVNKSLAKNNQFSQESMWKAFRWVGYRPEILRQLAGRVALNHEADSFSELLEKDASLWHNQIWEEFENDFSRLSSLQRALLTLLIKYGRSWSPFSEESMQYYEKQIVQTKLSVSSVQTALQNLREQGLVWQTSRGSYALEDESFAEWFKHTHENIR